MIEMRRMTLAAAVVVITMLARATTVNAQAVDEQLRRDIEKLLDVTGAAALGTQLATTVSDQMIEAMRRAQSNVPERAIAIIKETLDAEFAKAYDGPGGIRVSVVGIYAKYFTRDEVNAMLEFYGTPVGRKALKVLPTLVAESAAAGQAWAEANMSRILGVLEQRLRSEGLLN